MFIQPHYFITMRRQSIILLILFMLVFGCGYAQQIPVYLDASKPLEERVEHALSL